MLRPAILTLADQVVLSSVSLVVGIGFIHWGSPEQYGVFTAYVGVFYLFASAQNALLNTPLIVLAPRMLPAEYTAFHTALFALLLVGVGGLSALAVLGSFAHWTSAAAIGTMGVAFGPLLVRDFLRASEFANLRPLLAFKRDLTYAIFAVAALILLGFTGHLDAEAGLMAFGLPAMFIAASPVFKLVKSPPSLDSVTAAILRSWPHSRWSLAGALSSWAQGNSYVYIPLIFSGAQAVAVLAAARLLLTPLSLLIQSWSNYLRPLLSVELSTGDTDRAWGLFVRSSFVISAIVSGYTALVVSVLPLIPAEVLPREYQNISVSIVGWGAILLIQGVRSNASSLLQASLRFRSLAIGGMATAAISALATIGGVLAVGPNGALIGMVIGEVALLVTLLKLVTHIVAAPAAPIHQQRQPI